MRNYLEFNEGNGQKFKLKPVKDNRDSYARLCGSEEHFNEKSKITSNYGRIYPLVSCCLDLEVSDASFWYRCSGDSVLSCSG